jgi:hypothetical protein
MREKNAISGAVIVQANTDTGVPVNKREHFRKYFQARRAQLQHDNGKRPSDFAPEVIGLGSVTVMFSCSHANISALLK